MQGTSWEDPGVSLVILRTVWRAVCAGDILGGSQDVLRDPTVSEEDCVHRGHPGILPGCPLGSQVLPRLRGIFWTVWGILDSCRQHWT